MNVKFPVSIVHPGFPNQKRDFSNSLHMIHLFKFTIIAKPEIEGKTKISHVAHFSLKCHGVARVTEGKEITLN